MRALQCQNGKMLRRRHRCYFDTYAGEGAEEREGVAVCKLVWPCDNWRVRRDEGEGEVCASPNDVVWSW